MHFSRKLILLAAFMVGLGFAGSGEVRAAALVESVVIASPDSGALLGIDGLFQVRVVVEDFLEQPTLEIAIFLAERTATEPANNAYKLFVDDDKDQLPSIASNASNIDFSNTLSEVSGYTGAGGDFVRVAVAKTRTTTGKIIFDRDAIPSAVPPITGVAVDGDSLVLESTNNKQSVFVWYGKVHHSSGESEGPIFAGAYVYDPGDEIADNRTSAVVLSKESISIDADRTESPTTFIVTNGPAPRAFGTDTTVVDFSYIGEENETVGAGPDGDISITDDNTSEPNGTYMDVGGSVVKVRGVGTSSLRSDHGVLGIGDTLYLDLTLGGASAVLSGRNDDYQKIVLDVLGKERLVYQVDVEEDSRTGSGGVLNYALGLAEGDFDDFSETRVYHSAPAADISLADPAESPDGVTDTLEFFIVDKAGNRSKAVGQTDETPAGATAITKLLFDAKKPALDSVNGDTILPVTVDTISDGSRNAGALRIKADENQLGYTLASTLDSLVIVFDGADNDKTVVIKQAGLSINGAKALRQGKTTDPPANSYAFDFTQLGIKQGDADGSDTLWVSADGEEDLKFEVPAAKEEVGLKTGMHTIKFTGTDVAGNVGPTLTRENVYIDVDNIDFIRSFPFGSGAEESGLDTIEAKTAVVVFRLSEPADSVSIEYKGIAMGADADSNEVDKSRAYQLVGSQLTNTTSQQKFRIPGLQHDNQYVLQVAARDQAGNWFESVDDTFWYNTDYVVAEAAKFAVKITVPADRATALTALDKGIVAGQEIGINLEALSITDGNAPTYEETATLTVSGGQWYCLDRRQEHRCHRQRRWNDFVERCGLGNRLARHRLQRYRFG